MRIGKFLLGLFFALNSLVLASCEPELERERREGIAACNKKIPTGYGIQLKQCLKFVNAAVDCKSKFPKEVDADLCFRGEMSNSNGFK